MNKLQFAARQALGALVRAEALYGQPNADIQTALREALAEQAEHEPVGDVKALDYAILTLHSIACLTQSDNLLWWQERARSALARIDELLGVQPVAIYQEPASRAILCPPAPPEVYQMRSRDAFEAGWWEAQRQKAVSPISPVQQAEQEPVMGYERLNALREGEQNGAEDAYFFVRPENDTPTLRKMFCQGFERGFHKGLKYTAPVRTKDLTDDEAQKLWNDTSSIVPMWAHHLHFARAVIAADREKNK